MTESEKVLECLNTRGECTLLQVVDATNIQADRVFSCLHSLVHTEDVVKSRRDHFDRFTITESGRARVEDWNLLRPAPTGTPASGTWTDARQDADRLRELMQSLYLSTACAAGDHRECRTVDKYKGLPCCCTVCDHTDLNGSPPPASVPLLHYAEGDRRPGYAYDAWGMGARSDLVAALDHVLEDHVHELSRPSLAQQLAVAAALVFAPRSGA